MAPKKKVEEKEPIKWGRSGNTLKMGLVGLPNVGKSSTFNLLTKCNVDAENYPFCTIDPTEAVVQVPDERFKHLCQMFKPKSEVQAVMRIWDIAGLVPNAHQGEGLGNAFLSHIAAVDGIYHVCRAFSGEENNITHTEGEVDPVRDLDIIKNELIMKDLERLEKLVPDFQRKADQNRKLKDIADERDALIKAQEVLNKKQNLRDVQDWTAKEVDFLRKYNFLTTKPCVFLVNMSEKDYLRKKNKHLNKLVAFLIEKGYKKEDIILYSAEFEQKLADMETDDERQKYMKDVGADKRMLDRIITGGYESLGLMHFFTCGADEVRSWTIHKGDKAPKAAGVIHNDMERGFISMDVYKYADIKEHGTEAKVKEAGCLRQQGKNYEMCDGDICHVKFNVTTAKK